VKPLQSKPAPVVSVVQGKFKTITKYLFYESGKKWVKVAIDFDKISNHPREKIEVSFNERTFTLKVLDYAGSNWQFTVPKTQCKIVPEECGITVKSNQIVVNLRKAKEDDNWWSLFRTYGVGEVHSD